MFKVVNAKSLLLQRYVEKTLNILLWRHIMVQNDVKKITNIRIEIWHQMIRTCVKMFEILCSSLISKKEK